MPEHRLEHFMQRRRVTQYFRNRLALVMLAGLLLLTTVGVSASTPAAFIQEPDSTTPGALAGKPFATLKMEGSTLQFYEVGLPKGQIGGIGIAESVRAGYRGVDAIPRLRHANALEVFNALSSPGMRIPAELTRLYGRASLGDQGWGRFMPLANPTNPQAFTCMVGSEPFGSFSDDVEDFGYPFVFLSEADGPSTMPNHWWDDNGPADGTIRRKLQGGVDSKEYFFGKVSYCFEDHSDYPLAFQGRYAGIRYKASNSNTWIAGSTGQLFEPGDSISYQFSIAPGVNTDFDFSLYISAARPLDQFHIGATWADPDETIQYGE